MFCRRAKGGNYRRARWPAERGESFAGFHDEAGASGSREEDRHVFQES
jgi:hypothetical protein